MNEEEKKAIEELYKKATICDYELREYPSIICFKKDVIAILHLIEKQQKEIEKLRNNNKNLLRKLRNRVKEVKKLEKYSVYKKEFSTLNKKLQQKDNKIALLEQVYKELQNDFDNLKKDKDINYLDGIHHKKLVEKSIGQIIDKPEECWFDQVEVKIIVDNTIFTNVTSDDFITLKEIANIFHNKNCITVIAESPLSGTIYRYNNYGDKKWQLIGTMLGYA